MSKICIRRSHNVGRQEARQCIEEVARDLEQKLHADWNWQGDTLSFKRSGASGSVDVGEDFIEFNIKLSMVLSPLKKTIESTIENELDKKLG